MEILKVEGVSKQIKNHRILDNISFSIFENEIVGLIGPNGAGKSTIMKCITGLYHMNEGKITICGHDLKSDSSNALKNIGVSIEYPSLYPELSGHEHSKRIEEMEQFSDLKDGLYRATEHYSMGMKQRLVLALAMMAKPKLLIIDEPTNGLDPQAIFDLRNKLLTIRNEGTSILLSSHQLSELDKLADRALFIKSGKLIKEKNMDELRQNHSIYRLEVSNPKNVLLLLKKSFIKDHVLYMQCDSKEEFSKSLQILIQNNILVYSLAEVHQDLETYYKELYKG